MASKGTFNTSVTLEDDLFEFVRELKKEGNFSGEVNRLLKAYFTGGRSNTDSTANIRFELIGRDLEKVAADLELVKQALADAQKDFGIASEKRLSEKEKKEDQILERLEKEFGDIPITNGDHQYRSWARSLKLEGSDPQGITKNRIASIAGFTGASRADVMEIVVREYPGLIDLLNADPGVL